MRRLLAYSICLPALGRAGPVRPAGLRSGARFHERNPARRGSNPRLSRLSFFISAGPSHNQGVPLKHRAIEVPAAVVVLHAADRGGGNPRGGRTRRCPAATGSRRLPAAARAALQQPAAWPRRPAAAPRPSVLGGGRLLLSRGGLLLSRGRLLLGLGHLGRIRGLDWAPTTTAVLRRTPRIACASGTSCTGRSGTSAMSITTRLAATTAILSIVFMCFLRSVSAAGAAGASARMNVIRLAPWGGTKVNWASATAGATFQSLMTVVMLSSAGVACIGDDILARQRLAACRRPRPESRHPGG